MIPIAKPDIGNKEIEAVTEVLQSGMIAEGKRVAEFEEQFAEFVGTDHAVAVNSGTAALHVALLAHGIGKEDEVITTPFSFIATTNSILFTGGRPVLVDIEPDTFNIDPEAIKDAITPQTRALMPVHLYGHPAEMRAIMEIAEDHDLAVIEDACQAHGAMYRGKNVGSFGTGAFSFYPTKNMTTSEGGMITTSDGDVAQRARMVRSHGSRQRYLHEMIGYNMRMTDIAAAIGLVQLRKLGDYNAKRQNNAAMLSEGLRDVPGITVPTVRDGCSHVFHQYTIRIDEHRDELAAMLREQGIGTGIYYPIPIHKQPLYQELGYDDEMPVAEKASEQVLSLPVHPGVLQEDVTVIIDAIRTGVDTI